MTAAQVERVAVSSMTPSAFRAAFRSGAGRPVVVTGALQGMGLEDCTLSFIAGKLPAAKLPARHYGPEHFKKPKEEWKQYSHTLPVTPEEYATLLRDRVAHKENIYLAQVAIGGTELGRSMQAALGRIGAHCGLRQAIDLNLWWGPGGHTEPLHYDCADGTLVQLHGTKRVVMFPPSQTRNLYPFPVRRRGIAPWFSRVYVERPDFAAFPRLRAALGHRVETLLRPGELVFIPANWWHEVTAMSEDYVCSVNRFWKVEPLSRLFTNRLSPLVYGLSMVALAVANRRRARRPVAGDDMAPRQAV